MMSRNRPPGRRHQRGFIAIQGPRWLFGNSRFRAQNLFKNDEPGAHYEAVDPGAIYQRRNRLSYSSQFGNALWSKNNVTIATKGDGVGDFVLPNTTGGVNHNLLQGAGSVGVNNVLHARVRAGGYNFIALQIGSGAAYFNLSNGTLATWGGLQSLGGTATIQAAADAPGYYDCFVYNPSPINSNCFIYVASADGVATFAGDGVSGVYVARAQVEWNATVASAYQEITDWNTEFINGGTPVVRRNQLTYTEELGAPVWIKGTGVTVVNNDVVAPDGTLTADKLVYDGTGVANGVRISQNPARVPSIGVSVVTSVYLRANVPTTVRLQQNLTSAETVCVLTAQWQRFSVTGAQVAAGAAVPLIFGTNGNNDAFEIHMWGAQLEYGTVPTAYQKVSDWLTELYEAGAKNDALVTMWQESYGATPVTTLEQAVGLWMDTRLASTFPRGAELIPSIASLAPYVGTTGWSFDGGKWNLATAATNAECLLLQPSTALVVGRWYEVSMTITATTGSLSFRHPNNSALVGVASSATGVLKIIFLAGSTNLFIRNGAIGQTASIIKVSLKEILTNGNHAQQGTNNSRAILSARYNLLTKTEQLNDAAWSKLNSGTGLLPVVTDRYAAAPDGTMTASRLQVDMGTGTTISDYSMLQVNCGAIAPMRGKVWVRTTDGSTKRIYLRMGTGAPLSQQGFDVNGQWQLLDTGVDTSGQTFSLGLRATVVAGMSQTADLLVWHPDARSSDDWARNIPAYQRVNSATTGSVDYDTVGFPFYLKFDGTDDSMTSSSIDFSAVDKITIWAAVCKQSDAATAILAELSSATSTNAGTFYLATHDVGGKEWSSVARGAAALTATQGGWNGSLSPDCAVITVTHDIAGDLSALYRNGVRGIDGVADKGAGNFGNYPLFIARRNNTGLPFNGRIYSLTVRGTTTPTSEKFVAAMNRYAANLIKVSL